MAARRGRLLLAAPVGNQPLPLHLRMHTRSSRTCKQHSNASNANPGSRRRATAGYTLSKLLELGTRHDPPHSPRAVYGRNNFGLPAHDVACFPIAVLIIWFTCADQAKLRANMARPAALFALILAALAFAQAARLGVQKDITSAVTDSNTPTKYKNTKPLIGVLTQPCHDCPGKSYIAAGYVKWIEMGGGRAVPVR